MWELSVEQEERWQIACSAGLQKFSTTNLRFRSTLVPLIRPPSLSVGDWLPPINSEALEKWAAEAVTRQVLSSLALLVQMYKF